MSVFNTSGTAVGRIRSRLGAGVVRGLFVSATLALLVAPGLAGCRGKACRTCGSPADMGPAPMPADDFFEPTPSPEGTIVEGTTPNSPSEDFGAVAQNPPASSSGFTDGAFTEPTNPMPVSPPAPAADRASQEQLANMRAEHERRMREDAARLERLQAKLDKLETERAQAVPPTPVTPMQPVAPMRPAASATPAGRLASSLSSHRNLQVVEQAGGVVIRVTDSFRSGSDSLKSQIGIQSDLKALARALRDQPGAEVAVVGHSDGTPIKRSKWASNEALSLARAKTVATMLADNGVPPSRIAIDGRGARQPLIAPEQNAQDRAQNRRVEILVRW